MYSFAGLAEYAVVPETAAFLLPPILAERLGEGMVFVRPCLTNLGAICSQMMLFSVGNSAGFGGSPCPLAKGQRTLFISYMTGRDPLIII